MDYLSSFFVFSPKRNEKRDSYHSQTWFFLKSNKHQVPFLVPTTYGVGNEKSLSELEIINGAKEVIEGVECLRACGNMGGSGGGPVYMTDGQTVCHPQSTGGVLLHWNKGIP